MENINGVMNLLHRACAGNTVNYTALNRAAKQNHIVIYRANRNIPVTVYSWSLRDSKHPEAGRFSRSRSGVIPKGTCFVVQYAANLLESEYQSEVDGEGEMMANDYAVILADVNWKSSAVRISTAAYAAFHMQRTLDQLLSQRKHMHEAAEAEAQSSKAAAADMRNRIRLLPQTRLAM